MVNYRGKNVLVTGGSGFVGARLAERLTIEEGAHVRVLLRTWPSAVWVTRVPLRLFPGDVNNVAAVRRAMDGCEFVFHCASGGSTQEEWFRTNVDGTSVLLDAACEQKTERFVFVSSVAVHGPLLPMNANEAAPRPLTGRGYSDSKIEAENLVLAAWQERRLPVTILRPTFVWGPRSALFTSGPLLAMSRKTFFLVDGGAGVCNAVYVDNLVDALLLAGSHQGAVGKAFLITDGADISWGDFYRRLGQMIGIAALPSIISSSVATRIKSHLWAFSLDWGERLKPNPAPIWRKALRRALAVSRRWLAHGGVYTPWDMKKYTNRGRIDISRARSVLGYNPRYDLESGMTETAAWVRDQMASDLGLDYQPTARRPSGAPIVPLML